MKFLPLVWAGLWRKPLRTTLTTLALIVAFVLFGLLRGINAGFDILIATSRMDRVFVDARFGGVSMPFSYKQEVAERPGIKSITVQTFMGGIMNGDPKKQFFVGFADDGFFDYFSEMSITPDQIAELRSKRTAFIVSKLNADRWGLKVGDHVHMRSQVAKKDGSKDWDFDLIAIVDRPDLPGLYGMSVGNYEYLNEERASGGNMIDEILLVMNDPNQSVATAKAIDDTYINSGAPTRTRVEKLVREESQADNNVPTMVNGIVSSVLFALLLMTFNSIMQSFRERIPELGTLKALGFSDRQVLGLVLAEAVLQCFVGAGLGLAIARVSAPYAKKFLTGPAGFMNVPWSLVGLGLLVAFLVALISAAVPAWRASRMQIVTALAAR